MSTKPLLPTDPEERKKIPLWSGLMAYFPSALIEVAKVSYQGNVQHNGPGTPLRWTRSKSTDQKDTILRHMMESGKFDSDGQRHSAKEAWRALAALQLELEAEGYPIAEGADVTGVAVPQNLQLASDVDETKPDKFREGND